MGKEPQRISHDMPTFKKSTSVYDWIKSMEKAVDLGLMRKVAMEEAIQTNLKQK